MSNFECVKDFQKKFNCKLDLSRKTAEGTAFLLDAARKLKDTAWGLQVASIEIKDNRLLRGRLTLEEVAELLEAMAVGTLEEIAKEAADVHYTVYGAEDSYDIPADSVFWQVHLSNMTKTLEMDSGGKILKGPNYVPPNVKGALEYKGEDFE